MVVVDLSPEEVSYIKELILGSNKKLLKNDEVRKNIVVPDPTPKFERTKETGSPGTPGYVAPLSVIGTPLVEKDAKKKELIKKLMEKAEKVGYVFNKEEGGFGSGGIGAFGQMEG